jgi:DNA-binding transcriptional LysR family regulator
MAQNRNVDLYTLECFDMLLRERSVSRAAQRMDLSQSSMSDVLARLRERFGDPLLVRTREGMVPTERAQALWPQVREGIERLQAILERAADFEPAKATERFRITATDYAQLLLLPALVERLREQAPDCSAEVVTVNLRAVELALEAGEIDLAIAYYPEPPPALRRGPLFADRYVCLVRPDHPATRQALTAEEFAALPHVSVSPSGLSYFAGVVDSALQAQGLERRVVVRCPHFLIGCHLVVQSDLVFALPSRAAQAVTRFLPVRVVEIPLPMKPVDVSMYWHERCHHSRSHQWLRGMVRSILAPAAAE